MIGAHGYPDPAKRRNLIPRPNVAVARRGGRVLHKSVNALRQQPEVFYVEKRQLGLLKSKHRLRDDVTLYFTGAAVDCRHTAMEVLAHLAGGVARAGRSA
jgi:hypothetical protein